MEGNQSRKAEEGAGKRQGEESRRRLGKGEVGEEEGEAKDRGPRREGEAVPSRARPCASLWPGHLATFFRLMITT